ncbi:MAG TPA: hypothetical protein GX497_13740 [Bacillus bacterium]|nr:hypothetical protein [Bacillus sp. (in: firmicutes)]
MDLGELKAKISADRSQFKAEIESMRKELADVGEQGKKTATNINEISSSVGQLGNTKEKIAKLTEALDNTNAKIELQKQKLAELKKSYENAFSDSKKNKIQEQILNTEATILRLTKASDETAQKIWQLEDQMNDAAKSAIGFNSKISELNSTLSEIGLSSKQIEMINNAIKKSNPEILEKQLARVSDELKKLGVDSKQIEKIQKELREAGNEAKKTGQGFGQLNNALAALGAGAAFHGIKNAIKATIDEANKMQMSVQGLVEVSKSLNVNVNASTELAQELATKGFLSIAEASEAVKTSLAMGLNLEETKNLILALGDAAAYNRESHLEWGEAVVQAIRGIKQGNSTLTDSAGITTNLSVMYDRYAAKIGTTAAKLTEAQKVQAAYNGMLEESTLYAGNTESALDGLQGAQARYNASMKELKSEIGEAFMPIIADTLEYLTPIIIELAKWSGENENLVVSIGVVSLGVTGLISLLTAGAFAFNTIKTAAVEFKLSLGPVGWVLAGLSIAATGLTVAYSKMADETRKAEQAQKQFKMAIEQNEAKSMNLAKEYDSLAEKLKKVSTDTDGAKAAKDRMAEIMSELQKLSPGIVQGYTDETGAIKTMTGEVNSLTEALRKNTIEKMRNAKLALDDLNKRYDTVQKKRLNLIKNQKKYSSSKIREINAEIMKEEDAVRKQQTAIQDIYNSLEKSIQDQDLQKFLGGGGEKTGGGGVKTKGGGSSKTSLQKQKEDIEREKYQESLRYIQYKKNLNQMTVDDELAVYERLLERYKQYSDIRMELDEKIYQTKGVLAKNTFESSAEWIEQEERRMRLSGKTDQEVAQMKLDAWERVRSRYAENTEYYKQADTEVYNLRIQLMKEHEQALKDFQRKEEQAFKELQRKIIDAIKDSQRNELESIRKRKDAEIEALRDREKEELDSLDRRKREIEDFYNSQLDEIDEQETANEKAELIAELEKYRLATSKEGREKFKELQKRLDAIDREEHRKALRNQKDDELRNLDDRKSNVKDHYSEKERETRQHYDNEYEVAQEHYESLLKEVENYTGDVIGLEQMVANSRIELNQTANKSIIEQTRAFVSEYNSLIEGMKREISTPSYYGSQEESIIQQIPSGWTDTNNTGGLHKEIWGHDYGVDKEGKVYKNNRLVDSNNYSYLPDEVLSVSKSRSTGKYHTGGQAGVMNFSFGDKLMPDEIAAILQQHEYIFQPKQLESLLLAANNQGKGEVIQHNYNAPLFEHSGNVNLNDKADIKGWVNETDKLVTRLRANGKKGVFSR